MSGATEREAPWTRLAAEAYWTALRELPNVRPELRPMLQAHINHLRQLLKSDKGEILSISLKERLNDSRLVAYSRPVRSLILECRQLKPVNWSMSEGVGSSTLLLSK